MKNIALLLLVFLASCAPTEVYSPRTREPIEYHATPFITEVEWDIDFGETGQMALYCETIYITVEKGENGDVLLILRSDRSD